MNKNKSTVLILTLLLFLNFPFISYSQGKEVELVIYNQELYFGSKEGGGNYQNEVVLILKNNSNKKLAFFYWKNLGQKTWQGDGHLDIIKP